MLILVQFSARKVILFDPQIEKIFHPLLEVFQEVLLDICGISFLLEYDFTAPQKFFGNSGIITCYIMYHLISSRGLASLKNLSGKEVKKFKTRIMNSIF